jgi:hypothetical protein
MRLLRTWLAIGTVVFSVACGPSVDLTHGLQIDVVSTGWYESTARPEQMKLVPALSFNLKNVSDQKLGTLQVNAVFKRIDSDHEWATGFLTAAGSEGLAPGSSTRTMFVASPLGYTGTESRFDMLKNSHFVDAKVQMFAKYGSSNWTRLGEYPIARQLIEIR